MVSCMRQLNTALCVEGHKARPVVLAFAAALEAAEAGGQEALSELQAVLETHPGRRDRPGAASLESVAEAAAEAAARKVLEASKDGGKRARKPRQLFANEQAVKDLERFVDEYIEDAGPGDRVDAKALWLELKRSDYQNKIHAPRPQDLYAMLRDMGRRFVPKTQTKNKAFLAGARFRSRVAAASVRD